MYHQPRAEDCRRKQQTWTGLQILSPQPLPTATLVWILIWCTNMWEKGYRRGGWAAADVDKGTQGREARPARSDIHSLWLHFSPISAKATPPAVQARYLLQQQHNVQEDIRYKQISERSCSLGIGVERGREISNLLEYRRWGVTWAGGRIGHWTWGTPCNWTWATPLMHYSSFKLLSIYFS